jgi:hypothetical protein
MSASTKELMDYFANNPPQERKSAYLEILKQPVERDKDGNIKHYYTTFEIDKETGKSIAHKRFYFAKITKPKTQIKNTMKKKELKKQLKSLQHSNQSLIESNNDLRMEIFKQRDDFFHQHMNYFVEKAKEYGKVVVEQEIQENQHLFIGKRNFTIKITI